MYEMPRKYDRQRDAQLRRLRTALELRGGSVYIDHRVEEKEIRELIKCGWKRGCSGCTFFLLRHEKKPGLALLHDSVN